MFRRKPLLAAFKTAAILSTGACIGAAFAPHSNPKTQLPPPVAAMLASALIATVSVRKYNIEERKPGNGPF